MPVRADLVPALACPVCHDALEQTGSTLRCLRGHSFDVARDGSVNLWGPRARRHGDTAEMAAARSAFLGRGHYRPLEDAVRSALPTSGIVLDAGSGPAHYLAGALGQRPRLGGIALDASPSAVRAAARTGGRVLAVVGDVWRHLPVGDGAVDAVLSVFAPRNAAEFRRVLRPGGRVLVVAAGPDHLSPLVEALGLLSVGSAKPDRLRESFAAPFRLVEERPLRFAMDLDHAAVRDLVAMGPSARHSGATQVRRAVETLDDPARVTADMLLFVFEASP